jgi:AcrR family transcriptional regulator
MPDPATRERLLDAAWREVTDHGVDGLTLAAVGARAGVTRQAVYLHFGNRVTLLVEMAARFDRTSGFRSAVAATRHLPPRDGLRRMLELWFDYIPSILRVGLALEAASITGGDGADAYRDRMRDWREGIRIAIARVADDGELSPAWDVDTATDWTWASVHPTNVHHLTGERGWTRTDAARRIIESLERELLRPLDPDRSEPDPLPASLPGPVLGDP